MNTKKGSRIFALVLLLVLMMSLAACGRVTLSAESEEDGKKVLITADRADKGDSFAITAIEVAEGEMVEVKADLKKGSIRVELIRMPDEQSIEVLPDLNGEPTLTANLVRTDGTSATLPVGTYLLKANCLERATGTVLIEVKPAG